MIDTHDVIQSKNNIIYKTLSQEFLTSIYETAGTYLRLNDDLCKLSPNDRSIVIHNAADNVTCLGVMFIAHHCQLLHLYVFSNSIEIMDISYLFIINYI